MPARWERSAPLRILAGALLLLMAVLAGGSALRESVTIDEVAHIGAAVSYLQRLDVRFNGEHPPLPKIIAALPLVLRGVKADYSSAPWQRAADRHMAQWVFGEWVLERWNAPQTVLLWTRLPMLALTLALGWTVFVIGRRLGGDWGGLLSLTAYATSPTFLSFGPLVVTDVSVALFSLLTLWTFANLWRNPDTPLPSEHLSPPEHLSEPRPEGAVKGRFTTHSPRRRVIQFGSALACAILSKFTAGILLLAFVAVTLSLRWKPLPNLDKEARRIRLRATAQGILLAAAIVYAVYLVLSWNQPTDELDYLGAGPIALFSRRLLMPVWLCLRGVLALLSNASRPAFLLGRTYPHGVWFYFPVLFALKSTPGFLGLLLLAALFALRRWRALGHPLHWRVLTIGFAAFTAFCLLSRVNIGLRHFTVPMILLMVGISALPPLMGSSRVAASLAALCAASCVVSAIAAYPYYFPYLNVFGGGRPPYQLMGDSNIDWHQALPEVRSFAERHNLTQLRLDDYGLSDPVASVPQAVAWNCASPSPADAGHWAVVSGNMFLDFATARGSRTALSNPSEAAACTPFGSRIRFPRMPTPAPRLPRMLLAPCIGKRCAIRPAPPNSSTNSRLVPTRSRPTRCDSLG